MATATATATTTDEELEAAEAPQQSPRTDLRLCGRAARFRRLTAFLERARIDAARAGRQARLEARFPAAASDRLHPDREEFDALWSVHVWSWPIIHGCWAIGGFSANGRDEDRPTEPPTPEELEAADPDEVEACFVEIFRLNPSLVAARPNG